MYLDALIAAAFVLLFSGLVWALAAALFGGRGSDENTGGTP